MIPVKLHLLLLISIFCARHAAAQYCPQCMVEYDACAAACYEKDGYAPTCASMTLSRTPDAGAENGELYPNECAVKCYFDAYSGIRRFDSYDIEYKQAAGQGCEQEWKTMLAANYASRSTLRQFEPYLEDPVDWVQTEIDTQSDEFQEELNKLTTGEIDASLGACFVCDPDKTIQDGETPSQSPLPVVIPDSTPPSPAPEPKTQAPAPTPTAVIPAPVPAPLPTVPAPAPAPVVVRPPVEVPAPVTAPGTDTTGGTTGGPAPAPAPAAVSSASRVSSVSYVAGAVAVMLAGVL